MGEIAIEKEKENRKTAISFIFRIKNINFKKQSL